MLVMAFVILPIGKENSPSPCQLIEWEAVLSEGGAWL
jgi:hypothetical protein